MLEPLGGVGSFEESLVYRRAAMLADELHAAVVAWEKFERWTLGVQIVRAADSVGANIAEAHGRTTAPDRRRLLVIARGSLFELQHHLDRAATRRLDLPPEARARADEVGRMLSGLARRYEPRP